MAKTNFCNYTATILLTLFFSCAVPVDKSSTQTNNSEDDLEEITPFIETKVMLWDTTKLRNVKYAELPREYLEIYGARFLSYPMFNLLIKQLKQTLNNPKALIYIDVESDSISSLNQRRDLTIKCDSINSPTYDTNGKEHIERVFSCDSTSFWKNINTLKFFESWYYNKRTGEIVKKQLGYAIWQWDFNKQAFREHYHYFTSQEARAKFLKNY